LSICAVIPAAGKGTRLGSKDPKVFTHITEGKVVWNFLEDAIGDVVVKKNLILSPGVEKKYQGHINRKDTVVNVQDSPLGMGDAIFKGYDFWRDFGYILVVWGDQVNVSSATLRAVCSKKNDNEVTIPFVRPEKPYVEYIFENNVLVNVLQSREGDNCNNLGLSDIGVFLLPTRNLSTYWNEYLNNCQSGRVTKEINFLPFLVFLSSIKGLKINKVFVDNLNEARGLNTAEDLAFFRKTLRG